MTILDTNVFSEVVKPRPEPKVLDWLGAQVYHDVYLTAMTMAEVLHGLNRMPEGKRRTELHNAVDALFRHEFAGRILHFDEAAAIGHNPCQAILQREGCVQVQDLLAVEPEDKGDCR